MGLHPHCFLENRNVFSKKRFTRRSQKLMYVYTVAWDEGVNVPWGIKNVFWGIIISLCKHKLKITRNSDVFWNILFATFKVSENSLWEFIFWKLDICYKKNYLCEYNRKKWGKWLRTVNNCNVLNKCPISVKSIKINQIYLFIYVVEDIKWRQSDSQLIKLHVEVRLNLKKVFRVHS